MRISKLSMFFFNGLAILLLASFWQVQGRAGTKGDLPVTINSVPVSFPLEEYVQNTLSGGPPKDGIPAIDQPRFVTARRADRFLAPDDIIFGVILNGEVKAYPQKILVWHEIVNDRLGQENVSVTYCPLTGTAIGFKRGATTFGVSGRLVNNNLIMYDRATDSRWPQILATAITGEFHGKSLEEFRVIWTRWNLWKKSYPDTQVLSEDTSYARNYNRDPYGSYTPISGYYAEHKPPLFPTMHRDKRYPPKKVVIGARTRDGAIAFLKEALREKKILQGALGGIPHTAVYDGRLDTAYLYKNPKERQFLYKNQQVMEGAKQWAVDQLPLEKVNALDAMWFAWSAFYPKTRVYD